MNPRWEIAPVTIALLHFFLCSAELVGYTEKRVKAVHTPCLLNIRNNDKQFCIAQNLLDNNGQPIRSYSVAQEGCAKLGLPPNDCFPVFEKLELYRAQVPVNLLRTLFTVKLVSFESKNTGEATTLSPNLFSFSGRFTGLFLWVFFRVIIVICKNIITVLVFC